MRASRIRGSERREERREGEKEERNIEDGVERDVNVQKDEGRNESDDGWKLDLKCLPSYSVVTLNVLRNAVNAEVMKKVGLPFMMRHQFFALMNENRTLNDEATTTDGEREIELCIARNQLRQMRVPFPHPEYLLVFTEDFIALLTRNLSLIVNANKHRSLCVGLPSDFAFSLPLWLNSVLFSRNTNVIIAFEDLHAALQLYLHHHDQGIFHPLFSSSVVSNISHQSHHLDRIHPPVFSVTSQKRRMSPVSSSCVPVTTTAVFNSTTSTFPSSSASSSSSSTVSVSASDSLLSPLRTSELSPPVKKSKVISAAAVERRNEKDGGEGQRKEIGEDALEKEEKMATICRPTAQSLQKKEVKTFPTIVSSATSKLPLEKRVDNLVSLLFTAGMLKRIDGKRYALSIPKMGEIMTWLTKGRAEMLQKLKRSRFKEMLRSELEGRKLRKSPLGIQFHILDLLGRGQIEAISTSMGSLIRLSTQIQNNRVVYG